MELTWKLFIFVAFICVSMGIVGSPILKKLHEISDKLGATNDLIHDVVKKLHEIELKM